MSGQLAAPSLARLLSGWDDRSGPLTARLAGAVEDLVLDGRVPTGVRLPAERELATRLQLSRTTVTAAYARLRQRGFLVSRQGAGSWTRVPDGVRRRPAGLVPLATGELIDLGVAASAAPAAAVLSAMAAASAALPPHLEGHGYSSFGLSGLREIIAERYRARGLATDPEQILVTSGAQGALTLLSRHLVGPGDAVLIENPTYPNARDALLGAGGRLVPAAVGPEGPQNDVFADALSRARPKVAYVVPDFHNPTGVLVDEAGRRALLRAARGTGTQLIVDETMVDLAIDDVVMPPPVAALAGPENPVLTVGSMSKSFWGGLRIGWIRGPRSVMDALAAGRPCSDLGTPILDQLVATELLHHADELLPVRRAELRPRRDALAAALHERLPAWRFRVPSGGLSFWVELDQPIATRLARAARAHGVHVVPGPAFGLNGTLERYLRLPYALPVPVLLEAVDRLVAAYADCTDPRAGASTSLFTA